MSTEKEKTCGECKYFILDSSGFCKSNKGQEDSGNDCCSFFEPKVITNGDYIRQRSNRELAELITPKVMFCNGCPVKCAEKDIPQRDKNDPFGADVAGDVCVKRVEQWLNSEVKQ